MNNDKKKQELFVKYLKNKYGEKNLTDEKIKELKDSGQLQKDYQDFEKALAKKVAHGTKLEYFKSLKNQCAEDEELYYYKKGGSVGCGCKKKEGGEVVQAQKGTVVQKFKNRTKAEQDKINKQSEEDYFAGTADHTKPGISKPKREEPEQPKVTKPKPVTNIKKNSSKNVKATIQKCGGEVVKKFKAKCGSKMKKHQQGGSLNGVPFMQKGTPKGGVQYKPDWYKSISAKSGVMDDKGNYFESFGKKSLQGDRFNRLISTYWSNNPIESDTIYQYFPKKGQSIVAHSKFPQESSLYNKLKEKFQKIASIPSGRHYFDL